MSIYGALVSVPYLLYATRAQAQTASPVIISEVQIAGEKTSDDFVELYNQSDTIVNISKYRLRYRNSKDSAATGDSLKEIDTDICIAPHGYYLWSNKDSGIDANTNTSATLASDYSLALFTPRSVGDTVIDSVTWGGNAYPFGSHSFHQNPGKNVSMVRDVIDGTWLPAFSTQPTPTKGLGISCPIIAETTDSQTQNTTPQADIPKNIYLDTPAEFSVKNASDDTGVKYSWNFGDGHTSRLAQTTHTYDHIGTYTLTLTTTSATGKSIATFTLEVVPFPKQKVALMDINPNPSGTDTGNEYIKVLNTGKKKIDLSGWSIATGTIKKKLVNHPIREKLSVKAGKEATITQDFSTFSLPNKEGFIELRQPDGKAIDTIRYTQPQGGIGENQHYRRTGKKEWTWIQEGTSDPNVADKGNESSAKSTPTATDDALPASKEVLLNAIDTLSLDELALLRTRIEEKLTLTEQAAAETRYETTSKKTDSDKNKETAFTSISSENGLPYHTQSLLAEKHTQTIPSLLASPFPSDIVASSMPSDSLPLQELPQNRSEQPILYFLQSLNQALHSVTER